ncbi:hypothetical protein [Promicromonospora iranensis]|uniref:Uncharacterized protein n=1 Tax=Promicromonospora iranensis TaxID=1105144 RepID=A0ABU2CWT5_9MICO|nr:hypothetical protein [Promicromonospora iranensis]MDR7385780.1 hypothetical protein [Promicromonospora iranensis]
MRYYADSEGGDYIEDPTHADLVALVRALNRDDNTFFIVFPDDDDLEWSIAVLTRRGGLGGYEIERSDSRTGENSTVPAADPVAIATEVQAWAETTAAIQNTP